MYTFKTFLFFTMLCVVKSAVDYQTMCKNDYRDKNNNTIDVLEYCSGELCLEKCCGLKMMINVYGTGCVPKKRFIGNKKKFPHLENQYNSINVLSSYVKKTPKSFTFIQNFRNIEHLPNCTAEQTEIDKYDISEDGSLLWQDKNGNVEKLDKLKYCIDYKLHPINGKPGVKIVINLNIQNPDTIKTIRKYENVGLMISSFFLLLVLVVYCLLPDLRNLTGLVLMAYTFSLLMAFITKLIVSFTPEIPGFCKKFTPAVYFAFVSSFFWLSVYAFDVWWGLRSFRIKRNSKHGELVKFMWYSLYAWGSPLLLTAIVVTLDNHSNWVGLEPLFENCIRPGKAMDRYYKIPVGILIFVNVVLFCMTVYNIWMVKRGVKKCHDSATSKQQSSKFATYAKLFLMMGVTWSLELLPSEKEIWIYVLINSGNLLTGLSIFYLFVCNKLILLQLCKTFNIKNNYFRNLELQFAGKRTNSGITRSTALSSTVRSRPNGEQPQEMDLLQSCPERENIL